MIRGLREGKGVFYNLDGRTFKGEWGHDKREGFGVEEGLNLYEGEWLNDQKSGGGKVIFEDGSKYEG